MPVYTILPSFVLVSAILKTKGIEYPWPRGKSLLKIAYVIFVILKSHDFFSLIFVILVISSDFFV